MKTEITPPRYAVAFLRWFCPEHLYEEISGDLIQKFQGDVRSVGEARARRKFYWNTIRFFRPGILTRNRPTQSTMPLYMLANYFKVASRVMVRNKTYSIINIFGLALGITGAMLLFLWIGNEFSYDQFHTDKERIYQAWSQNTIDGQVTSWDRTPRILAPTIAEEFSSVETSVSYVDYGAAYLFTAGDTKLMKNSGAFTDSPFLSLFSFPLLKGNAARALDNPTAIVITEKFEKELFGNKDGFGETITIRDGDHIFPLTVTGILKDLPSNTEFHFEYLIPFKFLEDLDGKSTDWGNHGVGTYVKLKAGADLVSINRELKNISRKHTSKDNSTEIFLYPITKKRLYSRFENGVPAGGRIEIMRMMGILGCCLIAIACINFINLSTARGQRRSKEVGIRKVTGAHRNSLVAQFLCESVLVAFGAGVLSIGAIYIALPFFNELIGQHLSLNFQDITFWASAFGLILVVGLLAGGYPAFYLSSFNPVKILKGAPIVSGGKNVLRRILVVFQFGFAINLIVATVVVYRQIEHVQTREAGYTKDHLMYHYITGDLEKNYTAYKNELLKSVLIESVTKTSAPMTQAWSNTWALQWQGKDPLSKPVVERFNVDEAFTKTAGVKLVAGRDMDLQRFPSDSTAVLINEAAAKLMNFKQPLGELIKDGTQEWHVVGVIQDFVLTSPDQKIKPMILQGSKSWFTVIHIRLNPHLPLSAGVDYVSKLFAKYNPAYPFDYSFVEDDYKQKFTGIDRTLTITELFSTIAIIIAGLGLLGLSTYLIEARIKEIGIRKVLGGSVAGIIRLLSSHLLKPILISVLVFGPWSWYSLNWWLQSYDYHITLSVWLILGSGLAVLILAFLTTIYQTFNAARLNPVDTLRNE